MRVLMLTPDEGHLDRRIVQEAASLAHQGATVDIHAAVDPELRYEATVPPGVTLRRIAGPVRRPRRIRAPLRAVKRALRRWRPGMARLIEAGQYRMRDIAGEITVANRPGLLAGERYDLVFAHDIPVLPLALELRDAWQCGVVCDLHELFAEQTAWVLSEAGRQYWRSVEAALQRVDGILAVNQGVMDYVEERYSPPAPIAVVHNSLPYVPADIVRTGPRLAGFYEIPPDARTMVWAGTLRAQTNLETLIRGFGMARLDGWVLAIVGDGPLQDRLERLVVDERLLDTVFLGKRASQDDLVPLAASAHIGLLSYLPESDNLRIATPNKLFEYFQARLPIATTDLPEIARIVSQARTARFVDFSTPQSTAAGLRTFVDDALPAISEEQLEDAARRFSWERDEGRLLSMVEEVTRRTPAAGSEAP
jgi:glycosyltransferase involved in cell wall biosynthesis